MNTRPGKKVILVDLSDVLESERYFRATGFLYPGERYDLWVRANS